MVQNGAAMTTSAYATRSLNSRIWRALVLLVLTITEIAKMLTALRISVNWESIDYLRRIDGLSVPTLVFHGLADATVPIEASRTMAGARPQLVELVEVVDADHVATRDENPAAYDQRILAFLAANWR